MINRGKWFLGGIAVALVALAGLPVAAGAATIAITPSADALDVVAPCSLREAVQSIDQGSAVPGCTNSGGGFGSTDTISLAAGTYQLTIPSTNEDANLNGDLDITKPLVMTGAGSGPGGTVIDATGIDRAIDVTSTATTNNLQISGVKIENGSTTADGGAIRNSDTDATTTLMDSRLIDNHAGGAGGAIALPGGSGSTGLVAQRTEFAGNTAGDDGGAIFRGPNATNAFASIAESLFDHNTAAGAGGAVYQQGATPSAPNEAIYRNTTFDNNSATEGGGAIALGTNAATAQLNFDTFGGNATPAAGKGGALFGDAATIGQEFSLHATVFGGNTAGGVDSSCGAGTGSFVSFSDLSYNVESGNSCHLVAASPYLDVIGQDPLLAPLADNGGPTRTRGLYDGSPAIDHVPNNATNCTTPSTGIDQRNMPRPVGSACDAGAFEGSVGPVPQPPAGGGGAGPTSSTPTPFPPPTKKCKKKKAHKGAVAAKKKCKKKK